MGCRVCGAGIDYSWGPEWVAIAPGTYLIFAQLAWMVFEYLCPACYVWAKQHGALWDGKFTFAFERFKAPDYTARMAYGQQQIRKPAAVWRWVSREVVS